jgi:hypothetical protein
MPNMRHHSATSKMVSRKICSASPRRTWSSQVKSRPRCVGSRRRRARKCPGGRAKRAKSAYKAFPMAYTKCVSTNMTDANQDIGYGGTRRRSGWWSGHRCRCTSLGHCTMAVGYVYCAAHDVAAASFAWEEHMELLAKTRKQHSASSFKLIVHY